MPLDETSWALPPFYDGMLRPLSGSDVERSLPTSPSAFAGATVCCVRKPTKMNASAALALIRRVVDYHEREERGAHPIRPTATDDAPAADDTAAALRVGTASTTNVDVLLVERSPPVGESLSSDRRIASVQPDPHPTG